MPLGRQRRSIPPSAVNEAPSTMSRGHFIAIGVAASFFGLLALLGWLTAQDAVTPQMAVLMGIGLFGLYVGFGILIGVYRLINRLD